MTHNLELKGQRIWARQLNVENEGTHIRNDGGRLWVLGYKNRAWRNSSGNAQSRSERNPWRLSYTTTAGKLAPMFVSMNSDVFCFFHEVCFNGDPFETLIQESRGTETRTIKRGPEGTTLPYSSVREQSQ